MSSTEMDANVPLTSPARLRAAAAMRSLGHAFVAHQVDDDLMEELAEFLEDMTTKFTAVDRRREAIMQARLERLQRRAEGAITELGQVEGSLFADSFISGRANPIGINAVMSIEGDESVARVVLGDAFEGAPGRCHGGVVAAIIDETMGGALGIIKKLAFTGRLTVTYRGPVPLGQPIECRAKIVSEEGRKLIIHADLRHEDTVLIQSEALFIIVDPANWAE